MLVSWRARYCFRGQPNYLGSGVEATGLPLYSIIRQVHALLPLL